jgi:cytochrome P450
MQRVDADLRERMTELGRSLSAWAVFADPPSHTRLRSLFNKAFTARVVERLEGQLHEIVDELLTEALEAREVDFISSFAYPLPARVICAMLGIPAADIEQIRAWSDDVATFIGLPKKPRETYESALASNRALLDYFRAVIAEHRRTRPDDLVTRLLDATESGERLSEDELLATCNLLLFAAHTTTTHLLGNGILALLRHPEGLSALDDETIRTAVEELLRFDGPVQAVRRVARRDLTLGGRAVRAGDLVFVMVNAANRDPAAFEEAETLDVRRVDNRHIAFGFGAHFCAGAPLARLEARVAFHALATRCRLELADASPRWTRSFGFRGVERLLVRVKPR